MATSPAAEAESWARTAGALLVSSPDPWAASSALAAYLQSRPNPVTQERPWRPRESSRSLSMTSGSCCPATATGRCRGMPTRGGVGGGATDAATSGKLASRRHLGRERAGHSPPHGRNDDQPADPRPSTRPTLRALRRSTRASMRWRWRFRRPRREASSWTLRYDAQTKSLIDEVVVPAVVAAGDAAFLRLRSLPQSDTFPHLKVLSVDQRVAYIGSANLTWPALIHNVEMGVLVDGERVAVLDELFDQMLLSPPASPATSREAAAERRSSADRCRRPRRAADAVRRRPPRQRAVPLTQARGALRPRALGCSPVRGSSRRAIVESRSLACASLRTPSSAADLIALSRTYSVAGCRFDGAVGRTRNHLRRQILVVLAGPWRTVEEAERLVERLARMLRSAAAHSWTIRGSCADRSAVRWAAAARVTAPWQP